MFCSERQVSVTRARVPESPEHWGRVLGEAGQQGVDRRSCQTRPTSAVVSAGGLDPGTVLRLPALAHTSWPLLRRGDLPSSGGWVPWQSSPDTTALLEAAHVSQGGSCCTTGNPAPDRW
eukprot:8604511-Alexandrium_andersonii.AAC.1